NHEDVREAYQDRFRYLMVDEYQDTNRAQYAITQLLAAKNRNIMVVGDDDQSIYSWRGADLRNILEFESDYPEAKVVKLEQNYRSVGNILAAANAVIANNQHRKEKRLFTDSGDGEKISVYLATDERDEGRWIAGEIDRRRAEGTSYNNMAVFYRTNAQSRMLEDMLLRAGVPYRIVGGTRFFDRAEIRDVMAYLTLVVNPADDIAAKRVVNVPRRGIGKTTIERIDQYGREMNMPFLTAAELAVVDPDIRASTRNAVGEFIQVIKDGATYGGDLRKVVEMIIDKAGLIRALQDEGTDEARGRVENIQEFLGVVDEFVQTHDAEESDFAAPTVGEDESAEPVRVLRGDSLADFIEWVRLRTDLDTVTEDGQAVTLMTVHSSKGLEFDCVWVAGMEETLFPHMNSVGDAAAVEEERRLAYVAITRARKRLCLTCAQQRQIFGQTHANPVSRFIGEIPSELRQTSGLGSAGFSGRLGEAREPSGHRRFGHRGGGGPRVRALERLGGAGALVRRVPRGQGTGRAAGSVGGASRGGLGSGSGRIGAGVNPNEGKKAAAQATFAAGDAVDHKTFGRGTVVKVDGDTLHVKFAKTGQTKKLLKDYAPIVKIG
ncbi:MAG: ATP-dependent helicase, partial [Coriobacteriaceae bacterium]